MSKVTIVYKPQSEHARDVEDYMRDFYRRTGSQLDTLNPETRDGASFCRVYDVVEYPSVLAISDDGRLLGFWRGLPLPTISELGYYNNQG